ncbi:hypothetical protein ABZ215_13620 [Amycolatopsis sp. NPDC006131]|uniref:hypothetical protein n=1 Tax=Amycolatopsis sp. NPDC006131 TaxID=3156731 RepID=UPI0033AC3E88
MTAEVVELFGGPNDGAVSIAPPGGDGLPVSDLVVPLDGGRLEFYIRTTRSATTRRWRYQFVGAA